MKVMKIITGGQSGGDLSGNFFAKKYGIETEINAFEEFKPKYDELPGDIRINHVCDKGNYSSNLRCRTVYNVKNSDFTIILLGQPIEYTKGSKLTYKECKKFRKNCIYIDIHTEQGKYINMDTSAPWFNVVPVPSFKYAEKMIKSKNPQIINIAGERSLDKKVCVALLEKLLLDKQELIDE